MDGWNERSNEKKRIRRGGSEDVLIRINGLTANRPLCLSSILDRPSSHPHFRAKNI